jgi:hypothetical protein
VPHPKVSQHKTSVDDSISAMLGSAKVTLKFYLDGAKLAELFPPSST